MFPEIFHRLQATIVITLLLLICYQKRINLSTNNIQTSRFETTAEIIGEEILKKTQNLAIYRKFKMIKQKK